MSNSQFALSWEAHETTICKGLGLLQQNGEFVDMTLAADGHFVKVHQMIIALASPYIKELLQSSPNPHPVIFLNNISFTTLCHILEYIYTGEAVVSIDKIGELAEAGKNLHIKGLEDLKFNPLSHAREVMAVCEDMPNITQETEFDVVQGDDILECSSRIEDSQVEEENPFSKLMNENNDDIEYIDPDFIDQKDNKITVATVCKDKDLKSQGTLQYTVSNQGSLQIILNRYLYYLKHSNKNKLRQWRCVDYVNGARRCPAYIMTSDNIVIQRISAHTHPYHDKRILKKYKLGAIFSAIDEAEQEGKTKRKSREDNMDETVISI